MIHCIVRIGIIVPVAGVHVVAVGSVDSIMTGQFHILVVVHSQLQLEAGSITDHEAGFQTQAAAPGAGLHVKIFIAAHIVEVGGVAGMTRAAKEEYLLGTKMENREKQVESELPLMSAVFGGAIGVVVDKDPPRGVRIAGVTCVIAYCKTG